MSNPVTIAKAVTIHVLTDGTTRIIETPLDLTDIHTELPVYCETPEDALAYLDATDALAVNPKWYASEGSANE